MIELRVGGMVGLFGTAVLVMCVGGWLMWSSQEAVDAGASWEDSPAWWGSEIRVGGSRRGNRNDGMLVLDTNGDHWSLGLILATVGGVLLLGGGVATVGMSVLNASEDDLG